jgi:putative ABC transport system substrate-binding protein
MNRRQMIAALGGAAVWPMAARGQQAGKLPIIGFLHSEAAGLVRKPLDSFRAGLAETGFQEGLNVAIEYRWADGRNDVLPALAADLIRHNVNVIVTPGTTPASLAAKAASNTIPIIFFTAGDPVALGLVNSLNHPGGNATGATSLGSELVAKRVALIHELLPDARVVGLLLNPANRSLGRPADEARHSAEALGVQLQVVNASTHTELASAFSQLREHETRALVIAVDAFFTSRRELLGRMAFQHGIAAIYQYSDFAAAGGIMSYGGPLDEPYRVVGNYAGRVLKGEKPADLPVQQSTRIELVINLKAATTLGITVPVSLTARADEVIE